MIRDSGVRGACGDLRRLVELLELSRWRIAVSVGWGTLALGSGLGLAALAAWLIARAWQMPPVLDLSVAVVAVRALGISRGLCRYLERLATHDVALRAMTTARTGVYSALASADIWSLRRGGRDERDPTRLRRGDLLTRIGSDMDDVGAVVVRAFVPIAVALLLSIAAIGLLATVSPAAAAVLASALAVSGVVAPWLSVRAAREAELAVRDDRREFTAAALTVLDHAAELRVAGRLDEALTRADRAAQRAVAAEDRAAARSAWAAAATPLSIGVSVLGALLIGIVLYGSGTGAPAGPLQPAPPGGITPMALAVLVLLPLSAFEAVGVLPAAFQALSNGRAALRRITAAEPDRRAGAATATTISNSDRVSLAAPSLPQGRRIAVVGPSGAGKTTLLMRWAGLFDTPRPGITFFAEDAHLFGTTVLENLRVARGDLTAEAAETALRTAGLGDWLAGLPDGPQTDLVGGAASVSGGQRRRILLARALVSPARVLLLDEPTEHLEADAGADLLRALLDERSGLVAPDRTVVVVTHQLPSDHRADTVVEVDPDGRVSIRTTAGSAPN
ncbi:thiol reductant ABC exporter subunit CydC [Nocardia sp. BMG51109]|uniref:thiol reductant ABC exporter subunit CydC n=1 Tax=Nocardia sp. BMG51109 TaxID=1056816 RepID=UPI001E5E5F62|nr:thiol reductant ABC exporter subunit CydC [Nocardia sp. BMG51109]